MEPSEIERWEERARSSGLSLERIEPDGQPRPRARWYAIHLQPTLLDGVDLVRQWGRLGTRTIRPQRRAEHFPDVESALTALRRLLARRRLRGYVASGIDAGPPRGAPRRVTDRPPVHRGEDAPAPRGPRTGII